MTLAEEDIFAREQVFPSWFANAIQKFLSASSPQFALTRQDATHVQCVAGAAQEAQLISVAGKWRWIEATINRAHPGGAAGTYDIYVGAANNKVTGGGVDETNRAFVLRIVEAGKTPAIEAGIVDIFRKVGSCIWSGTEITSIAQTVGAVETLAKPGDLRFTHRTVLDPGWVKAEGQELSRTVYNALWKALGEPNTGNGTTTFTVPDYRERTPIGVAAATPLGSKGGEATHVISLNEMPKHKHSGQTSSTGAHSHSTHVAYSAPGEHIGGAVLMRDNFISYGETDIGTSAVGDHFHTFNTNEEGTNAAHNNMQPYTVCNVWIKV